MHRAKAKAAKKKIKVELAAVVIGGEENVLPRGFLQLPSLTRSTRKVYPHLYDHKRQQKRLRFIQDIPQCLVKVNSPLVADYMVYTNSDNILHEDFYCTLLPWKS